MAVQPENVVVAGTGTVWVADEGTALPTTLAAPGVGFVDLGYVSEDGVTFTLSRESEDVNAWQASEPIRTLITAEPKQIAFELMEFGTPDAVKLALRGGTIAVASGVATLTPPAAGTRDVRAMVIDAVDGDSQWRFTFERVELTGDTEFGLVKSDATRLPLEFAVGAGGWKILTDHPDWVAAPGAPMGGGIAAPADELIASTSTASDAELEAMLADSRKTVRAAAEAERARRAG